MGRRSTTDQAAASRPVGNPRGRHYWRDSFTLKSWDAFCRRPGRMARDRASGGAIVKAMKPGDYLLCCLADAERWIAVLEIDRFQGRAHGSIPVRPVAVLSPETGVPFAGLESRLRPDQAAGEGRATAMPTLCDPAFGEAIVAAVLEKRRAQDMQAQGTAGESPAKRPLGAPAADLSGELLIVENPTLHTEIQWLLAKLGNDMGLEVWVARNDRRRVFRGRRFTALPHLVDALPVHFDTRTKRTVELIDVLWMRDRAIVSAFEIESTTSIYTGLLRMADLVAMQPNLNIPLFLVAGAERRSKVLGEVNRPVFSRLNPPLNRICRFIAFEKLRTHVDKIAGFARHMNPSFLAEVSEACGPESSAPLLSRSSAG